MSASQDIFRAYDIRGVYGDELDAEIGERVGLAFGNYLRRNHNEGKVSIGVMQESVLQSYKKQFQLVFLKLVLMLM